MNTERKKKRNRTARRLKNGMENAWTAIIAAFVLAGLCAGDIFARAAHAGAQSFVPNEKEVLRETLRPLHENFGEEGEPVDGDRGILQEGAGIPYLDREPVEAKDADIPWGAVLMTLFVATSLGTVVSLGSLMYILNRKVGKRRPEKD